MSKTIDLYGADDLAQIKRPFTISLTEESSPAKKFNLSYLLAKQCVKENRKKSQFSLYHITQRDYYHPSYLPTRYPANLQMQNLNNTTKSIQSRQTQFSKLFNQKYKALPLSEQNQQGIYKNIDFKNKILERMLQIRNRSLTCKIPESSQFRTIQTDNCTQSPIFQLKNQEIYTNRPPQSRVNSSFQKCKKICLVKPTAYVLGLNVEKCKILDRLKTISSSPQGRPVYVRKQKANYIQDIPQRGMVNKPAKQQLNFKKKSSVQLAKWEYSDLEND
ncbi:unnamed protein product (macronuclear) [Paramecium tetraurelia]|uniref:Uncharacterized protein n=1 Tax=Paramecium tetraurelia TaxID=5888 RepID=A0DC39_PARTE|nr:uncharacterized protein GSPATT00015483001 [Paramecium tetraurelia]CAK80606.1 unnamed protein product [Paramecium tetraurelia]|eukprot:XP_001448003.1 hypothetical protein (macronuclear) [Paramecium tetraurelia strain d4-2]